MTAILTCSTTRRLQGSCQNMGLSPVAWRAVEWCYKTQLVLGQSVNILRLLGNSRLILRQSVIIMRLLSYSKLILGLSVVITSLIKGTMGLGGYTPCRV